MRKFTVLAGLLILAASSSNCSDTGNTANMLAPSPNMVASSDPGGSASLETFGAGRGKGHGNIGTPSSAIEPTLVGDYNADGIISWGDAISFDISTTETWNQVSLVCSQNGSVVLGAVRIPTASYPITLSSQAWQSGAADCVATLDQFNGTKVNILASVSFTAGA